MKAWILPDLNNKNEIKIEFRSHKPKDAICEAIFNKITGEIEDAKWIQIENIENAETGELIPTATINKPLKEKILADKKASKSIEPGKIQQLRDLAKQIKQYDPDRISDINDIRDLFRIILLYLKNKDRM